MQMKWALAILALPLSGIWAGSSSHTSLHRSSINPLGTVITLLEDLQTKVAADQKEEAKDYKEYNRQCEVQSQGFLFEISKYEKTEAKEQAKLDTAKATIAGRDQKIQECVAAINKAESDRKEAMQERGEERRLFVEKEKEMLNAKSLVERALAELQKKKEEDPAALAQINATTLTSLVQTLGTVVDAAGLSSQDRTHLVAFVQGTSGENEEDEELNLDDDAQKATVKKTHTGKVVQMLDDLKTKIADDMHELQGKETKSKNAHALMEQSLQQTTTKKTKEMNAAKTAKAKAEQDKAQAEQELGVAKQGLAEARANLEMCSTDCGLKAQDHAASVKGFDDELKVIAQALTVLKEHMAGSTYYPSFVQLQKISSKQDQANADVVALVQNLARDQHSAALQQLASRISSVLRYGSRNGADPLEQVRKLIQDLMKKLKDQQSQDKTLKDWCFDQKKQTEESQSTLEDQVTDKKTEVGTNLAAIVDSTTELEDLNTELTTLQEGMQEATRLREEEKAAFKKTSTDLENGLAAVGEAMTTLQKYYQDEVKPTKPVTEGAPPTYSKADGVDGIINILELCSTDMQKDLTLKQSFESDAEEAYEKQQSADKVSITLKQQSIKHTEETLETLKGAKQTLKDEMTSLTDQQTALEEYLAHVQESCVIKPESYEAKKERRDAELAGLVKALSILEGASLVQRVQRKGRNMRGSLSELQ